MVGEVSGEVVYVVQAGEDGLCKIGTTTSLDQRMRTLQSHSPLPLTLLGTVAGGRAMEASFHRQFARYRQHGEWFRFDASTLTDVMARVNGEPYVVSLPRAGRRQMTPSGRKLRKKYYGRGQQRPARK